jgi:polyhydroxyalkanoate synthesis regulator phasin
MTDRLDEIKRRLRQKYANEIFMQLQDVDWLISEVERLRRRVVALETNWPTVDEAKRQGECG